MTKEEFIKWAKKKGYQNTINATFEKDGIKLNLIGGTVFRESKDCINNSKILYASALLEDLEIIDSELVDKCGWGTVNP